MLKTQIEKQEDFLKAIKQNKLSEMKILYCQGIDLTYKDSLYLSVAIEKNNFEIVQYLISIGVDVTENKNEAIEVAASSGNTKIIKLLVENGADIHVNNGRLLATAASKGHLKAVKYFIANGIDVNIDNSRALISATHHGNAKMVSLLIENGATLNRIDSYSYFLSQAIEGGDLEVVKELMKLDLSEYEIKKMMSAACNKRNLEMLKVITEKNKEIDISNPKDGFIFYPIRRGYKEIVEYYVKECNLNIDFVLEHKSIKKELKEWVENYKNIIQLKNKLENDLNTNEKVAIKKIKI